ncbi:two-component sensor histidine kinase [Streptomyces sp. TRM43335]|uniref:histidine kinase n=2 Tax=Streptomyces taklimakanensis TaxID=2569853 RepID=A0A6G2BC55_9ACTN|nr:histidine kinase [Streptomyces taklimakanensis]MTE19830.1 two-component sensor histidine kinase [Streptomyces taklimakanensis]
MARDALRCLREDLLTGAFAFRPLPALSGDRPLLRRLPDAVRGPVRRLPHLAVVALALLLMFVEVADGYHDEGNAFLRALLLGVPLVLVLFRPVGAFWLSIAGLFVVVLFIGSSWSTWPWTVAAFVAHLVLMLIVAARSRTRVAAHLWWVTALAGWAATEMGAQGYGTNSFAMAVVSGLALVFLLCLRGWRDSRRQVVEQVAVAEEERSRRTLLEERTTIARELHDVVAHHMSVVAIQAEAAPYRVQDPPEELVAALAGIRENAVTALTELRRVLGVVRADLPADLDEWGPEAPQPTLAELDDLLANVRRAGLEVESVTTGRVRTLPQGVELSAYRIVQEALSNALRHAPGAAARIELGYVPMGLGLRIVNGPPDGLAKASSGGEGVAGAGHGLLGMRERAAMLGGELTAEATDDGGFVVEAFLPGERSESVEAAAEAGTVTGGGGAC